MRQLETQSDAERRLLEENAKLHTPKIELVHGERFRTRAELTSLVFEYIELYYNRTRRHSAIGCISPMAYEALNVA